jgi:transposase InsO family protein
LSNNSYDNRQTSRLFVPNHLSNPDFSKWVVEFSQTPCRGIPGKPQQNAFVESFNGKFRKECLDLNSFVNPIEARDVISKWRVDYNNNRPHSSLNFMPPAKYRENYENNVISKRVTLQVV